MNSKQQVQALVKQWVAQGLNKWEIVVNAALAYIGWPYVWGATGQDCTVEKRRYYMNRSAIGAGDAELIRKRCQILNGNKSSCDGCKYHPNGQLTSIHDCQGFIKKIFQLVGITLTGAGCTSMWNDKYLCADYGTIDTMPKDKVCCTFKQNGTKMDHILLYDGNGNYIHCSGEVKKQAISTYKATHWAIPKGLYSETSGDASNKNGLMVTYPTIRRGARGDIVIQLQDLLAKAGSNLQIDGIFGSGTQSAVRAFQNKYDLEVDGIVGPKTWTKLLEVAGNIHVSTPDPVPEQYVTLTIPEIKESEADELIKKYPRAEKSRG